MYAPLMQRQVQIVGNVLFTATHVAPEECVGLDQPCYPLIDLDDEKFFKESFTLTDSSEIHWQSHEDYGH